jgi:hypothetical protein
VTTLRKLFTGLGVLLAVFLIVRAVVELFVIDFSDPSSYASDWGGPSLVGVLIVQCLPGVLAAIGLVAWWRRRRANDGTTAT